MPDGALVDLPDNPTPELKQRIKAKVDQIKMRQASARMPGHSPEDKPVSFEQADHTTGPSRVAQELHDVWDAPLGASDETMQKAMPGHVNDLLRGPAQALTKVGDLAARVAGSVPVSAAAGDITEGLTGSKSAGDRSQRDTHALIESATPEVGTRAGSEGTHLVPAKGPGLAAAADRGLAAWFGRDPEAAKLALANAEKGLNQAPGSYLTHAPRLQRNVEMSRKLGYDPTAEAGAKLAEGGVQKALEDSGMSLEEASRARGDLRQVAEPSFERSGEAIRDAGRQDYFDLQHSVEQDTARIQSQAKAVGEARGRAHATQVASLQRDIAGHEAKAQSMIDQGWAKVEELKRRPGDVAGDVAKQVDGLLHETKGVANEMYDWAREAAGDVHVNTRSATPAVKNLLENMPETVFQSSPKLRQSIDALANGRMSFGELQGLRSQLRDLSWSDKLAPDLKRGPLKYMSKVVDDLLTRGAPADKGQLAQLREGRKLLAQADTFYARNMPKFQDQGLQQLVGNLKTGLAPDAEKVASQIAHSDNANLRKQVLAIAGRKPGLVDRIRNADFQSMVRDARSPATGEIDTGKLMRAVDERARSGVLQDYYGPQAGAIQQLTRRMAQQGGKLDLDVGPQDNFVSALKAAAGKQAQLKELARANPERLMEEALVEGDKRVSELSKTASAYEKDDPLMGLRSAKAEAASRALLDDPTRLRAAVQRWGDDSKAVTLLRQEAVKSLIAPVIRGGGGHELSAGLARLKPEVQAMLFPKGLGDDLQLLAKQLDFIHGPATGSMPGMAAGEALGGGLLNYFKKAYYYEAMARLTTHPKVVRLLAGGLKAGGEQARVARNKLLELAYGRAGASASPQPQPDHAAPSPFKGDWRTLAHHQHKAPQSDWRKAFKH